MAAIRRAIMCGRFTQKMTWREVHELYGLVAPAGPSSYQRRYNGAPSQTFALCRVEQGAPNVALASWGLRPQWANKGRPPINARAESVATTPYFRNAFKRRRCLIPADGWFEWQRRPHRKQPYFLRLADGSAASFAGVWERRWDDDGEPLDTFAIITAKAGGELARVHGRQPVVIAPRDFDAWLDHDAPPAVSLGLLEHAHPGPFALREVNDRVNNARNDDAGLLQGIAGV